MAEIPMSYGTASRPAFSDIKNGVADLPHKYLPTPTSPEKRLVIVGDVHGQLTPLKLLLEKLSFNQETDHLIFAGDMVSKGPDSAGVVQLAMDLGASAVRGNHEDRVLLAQRQQEARPGDKEGSWFAALLERRGEAPEPPPAEPSPGTEADVAVASRLDRKHLKWIASLPIILRLGPFTPTSTHKPWNAGTVAVVHAGLVPGVALDKQDLRAAMNMRTLVYPAQAVRREIVKKQLEEEMKQKLESASRGRKVEGRVDIKKEWVDDELRRLEKEEGFEKEKDKKVWFPVDGREGEAWSEVWSREQLKVEEEGDRVVVVYGHDAKAGLRVGEKKKKGERYAFGLDSGCVYGNQLSAMVLEMDGEGAGVRHRVVQVGCEKAVE
ncbi:Metallo-dependent phosphatase-like protein, partial [Coniochaeta sp. 2T2.1]